MSLLHFESYQKGIIYSTLFNVIAKILLFANSIVIAYYFGTQLRTDIYFFVFMTIAAAANLMSSLNIAVLIPESMRIKEQDGEKQSMRFLNFFLYGYLFFGAIMSLVLYCYPIDTFILFSKIERSSLTENIGIIYWALPLFGLILLTSFLTDILTSYKFFSMPMIAALVNNLFALIFIVVFHKYLGIISILVGLNSAYIVNLLVLILLIKRRLNWVFSFRFIKINKKIWKDIIYVQSGNLTSMLSNFAPAYIFSSLSGIITALNYGQKTANMPSELVTNQFVSVSGIRFNELYAQKNYKQLNLVFLETGKLLLFVLIPISMLMFLLSEEIISFFYQRGKFDAESVCNSALFLKYLVFLLPFYAISGIASRLYMAAQLMKYSFWYQIIANILQIALLWFFIKQFDIVGFPLALLIQYIINILVIWLFLYHLLPFIQYYRLIKYFIGLGLLNLVLLLLFYIILPYLAQFSSFERMSLVTFLYLSVYLGLNFVFKINYQVNTFILTTFKRLIKINSNGNN